MKTSIISLVCGIAAALSCTSCVESAFERKAESLPEFESVWSEVRGSSGEEREYLEFLYAGMPLPDACMHGFSYWKANVDKTLEVRDRMGWNVPEREFLHFVLPLRVNNEALDDFRIVYADTLCARVKGMTLREAALEVNHWCHEQASYHPSDARTLSPMSTVACGLGRCGEESVLAVAALRAAGIPARQVYTPRWAHTDDNHAWVEVFVDGAWHFMGACEPEAVLDLAWFNAPVSRAMLLHTKAFGDYHGPEDVISRTSAYTEINVIKGYIPACRTSVKVVDTSGDPVSGARVEFKIYNYAEYYTVATYFTGADGTASLDTGVGEMVVWASKGELFGLGTASGPDNLIVLNHRVGEDFSIELDIEPPVENPIPSTATPEQAAANAVRLSAEDAVRASHPHDNPVVAAAVEAGADLSGFSAKDMVDLSAEVLEDASPAAAPQFSVHQPYRVEYEPLAPHRREMLASGLRLGSPSEAVQWVRDSIRVDDSLNPQGLRLPPLGVWRWRVADSRSRDIFFVALCRAFGFEARYDQVTSAPQYREGGSWVSVDFGSGRQESLPSGMLELEYTQGDGPVKEPGYYTHYTLARISVGDEASPRLCEYDEGAPSTCMYSLDEGYYMLTSGTRLADGSVLARSAFFSVPAGGTVRQPLVLRSSAGAAQVIGNIDAEMGFLKEGAAGESSILSATGRGFFLLAVLGKGDEPSNHAARQLAGIASDINAWGRPVLVLDGGAWRDALDGLDNAVFGSDPGAKVASMLAGGVKADASARLPYVAVCDSFGRVVYFSQGYNTSLSEQLRAVIMSDL